MLHNHEFLFVTGKYCIYIPTHCFQFAYATQSLVFICHRQILHLYTYSLFSICICYTIMSFYLSQVNIAFIYLLIVFNLHMLHNHEFLFVTGKYCIYIPTHCFQFAYATQS